MPLVSIIMPAFNVGSYISEAIASVLAQDYLSIELIIVDDGSTDDTLSTVEEMLSRCHLEHVVISQENAGVSAARNRGVSLSHGDYFICIDPDDVLVENAISSMVSYALESEMPVVACDYFRFMAAPDTRAREASGRVISQSDAVWGYCMRTLRMFAPGLLLAANLKTAVKYDDAVRFEEDIMYVWGVLFDLRAIGYIDAPLYGYRKRPGSTMTAPKFERVYRAAESFDAFFQTNACCGISAESFYGRWLLGALHVIALTSDYGRFREAYERLGARQVLASLSSFPQRKVRILAWLASMGSWPLYASLYATRLKRDA